MHVIQWIFLQRYSIQDFCSDDEWEQERCEVGMELGSSGETDIVKYLASLCYKKEFLSCCAVGAVRDGHLPLVRWLLEEKQVPQEWFENVYDDDDDDGFYAIFGICDTAAEYGHKHILEWLRAQDPPYSWSEQTCYAAAANGEMTTLIWLRSQDPPYPWDPVMCNAAATRYAEREMTYVQRVMAQLENN